MIKTFPIYGSTEDHFFAIIKKHFAICGYIKNISNLYWILEGKYLEHHDLISEKRSSVKIMLFDPDKDLPIDTINCVLQKALNLYTKQQ